MKAILLAAGRGSRLGSLTDEKPKALVELNGVPLARRAVDTLRAGGIGQVGIVGGYRWKMLARFADRMFINPDWNSTGIFQSLSCASEWLESEPCLVSYGDIFYSPRLVADMIKSAQDVDLAYDPNAVTLWRHRFDNPLDDMERFEIANGRVGAIGGRAATLEEIQGQYMGLFRLTPRSWRLLLDTRERVPAERRANVDMTSLFSLLIQAGTKVGGTPTVDSWGEIDCASDVKLYERLYPKV
jgi:choline kinase